MKKQTNSIYQEVLPLDMNNKEEWPSGYHKGLELLQLNNLISENKVFGFDIETEGLIPYSDGRILSIGFSDKNNEAYVSLLDNEKDLEILKEILSNKKYILVGHNIKYDVNWITIKLGIKIKCMLFDTMFAQYLINENIESNSLGYLVSTYFEDLKGYKESVNRNNLKLMPKDELLLYNGRDADASRRLKDVFVPKLKQQKMDKLMIVASMVLPILSKMETRGVCLDKEYSNKIQIKLFNELVGLRYTLSELAKTPFNPDSPPSLSQVLYKNLGFRPISYTNTNKTSTNAEALNLLVDQVKTDQQKEFLFKILEYKKKIKLITTYYQPISKWTKYDGRVHPTYSLGKMRNEEGSGGTVTARLSCKNPNLQNIPRGTEHRGMFAPTKDFKFIDFDFSQLELRVAAYLSQEPVLIKSFKNGLDVHTSVMCDMLDRNYKEVESILKDEANEEYYELKENRVAIKRINFGILYGVQATRLQNILRLELKKDVDLEYCSDIIKQWLDKYEDVKLWIKRQKNMAVSYKFVSMPLGQKRRLPDASFETPEGRRALRQATNFPVQSFASWVCLIGLIILDKYFEENKNNIEAYILLQVHDSVTSEVKILNNQITYNDIIVDIKNIMEQEILNYLKIIFNIDFNVPLEIDIKLKDRWS